MNLAKLEEKLLAAARSLPVSDLVPYAFEKRILAQIKSRKLQDKWSWWARALWRAAAPCVGIMLLLGVWSYYDSNSGVLDLSQEFENTVLGVVQPADSAW
jgi:hypothetical protein